MPTPKKSRNEEPMIPIGEIGFVHDDQSVRQVMIHRWITRSHSATLKPQPGAPWYSELNADAERLYEVCWMDNNGDIEYDQVEIGAVFRTADAAFSSINERMAG